MKKRNVKKQDRSLSLVVSTADVNDEVLSVIEAERISIMRNVIRRILTHTQLRREGAQGVPSAVICVRV